jgi:rhamnulokinase
MTADATGRTVVAGPYEATAVGNLLVQAMGCGDLRNLDEIRAVVRASFAPQTYHPQNTGAWDDAYGRYVKLLG